MPAQAAIHLEKKKKWIPAFAGRTLNRQHDRRRLCENGRAREGIYPRWRYFSGGAVAAFSRLSYRRSICTAWCAQRDPSPFLYYFDLRDFRSSAPAPKSSCACATARSRSAPSRAPARAASATAGQGAGRRITGRSQGTGRASDAARSRAQRCRAAWRRPARSKSPRATPSNIISM